MRTLLPDRAARPLFSTADLRGIRMRARRGQKRNSTNDKFLTRDFYRRSCDCRAIATGAGEEVNCPL